MVCLEDTAKKSEFGVPTFLGRWRGGVGWGVSSTGKKWDQFDIKATFNQDSGSSGPGSHPGRGHCVVFLGKTLYSHGASLHPGV